MFKFKHVILIILAILLILQIKANLLVKKDIMLNATIKTIEKCEPTSTSTPATTPDTPATTPDTPATPVYTGTCSIQIMYTYNNIIYNTYIMYTSENNYSVGKTIPIYITEKSPEVVNLVKNNQGSGWIPICVIIIIIGLCSVIM